jgi:catechol 2,3-dioxygenase-like lactoylglutathione lyase family enzyme|tara:strand:- start:4207 stop:4599 length:393 start_codon:yes stop_codon:yes gene_type:complete
MNQFIAHVTLLVKDYDEAIAFYTKKLSFKLIEDTQISSSKRWVRVCPPGRSNCSLLFAKAKNDTQMARVGDQTGGRVILFLHTDNFDRDYDHLIKQNIEFIKSAKITPHGKVAVFADLYGNLIDLVEPSS